MADGPELNAYIGADTGDFQEAVAEAARSAQDSASQINSAFSDVAGSASSGMDDAGEAARNGAQQITEALGGVSEILIRLAEAFGLFKLGEWAKEAIESSLELGEKLENLHLQTGISVESLQKLQYAGAATGVSMDRLVVVISRLANVQRQIATGRNTAAEGGLALLGVKPGDLSNPYETLLKIGDAIDAMKAKGQSAVGALASVFGGRFGAILIPALAQLRSLGDELQRMGLVLNEQTVGALAEAQEGWNKLGFAWKQAEALIVANLTPELELIAGALISVTKAIAGMAKSGDLGVLIGDISKKLLNAVADVLQGLAEILGFLAQVQSKLSLVSRAFNLLQAPGAASLQKLFEGGAGDSSGLAKAAEDAAKLAAKLREAGDVAQSKSAAIQAALNPKPGTPGAAPAPDLKNVVPGDPAADFKKFTDAIDLARINAGKDAMNSLAFAVAEYNQALHQLGAEAPQTAEAEKKVAEAAQQVRAEMERDALSDLANSAKVQEAQLTAAQASATGQFNIEKAMDEAAIKSKAVTAQQGAAIKASIAKQETALEIDQANERFNVQKAELDQEIAYLQSHYQPEYESKIKQLQADVEAMEATHQAELSKIVSAGAVQQTQLMSQALADTHTAWDTLLSGLSSGFDKIFNTITSGSRTMKADLLKDAGDIVKSLATSGIKELLLGGGKDAALSQGGLAGLLSGRGGSFFNGSLFGGNKVDTSTIQANTVYVNGAVAGGGSLPGDATVPQPALTSADQAAQSAYAPQQPAPTADSGAAAAGGSAEGGLSSISSGIGLLTTGIGLIAGNTLKTVIMLPLQLAQLILHTGILGSQLLAQTVPKEILTQIDAPFGIGASVGTMFARGGDLADLPNAASYAATLHPREMVLPEKYADVIRDMAANGGNNGGHQVHMGGIHIHAIDHQSFNDHLHEHSAAIAEAVGKEIRRGNAHLRNAR